MKNLTYVNQCDIIYMFRAIALAGKKSLGKESLQDEEQIISENRCIDEYERDHREEVRRERYHELKTSPKRSSVIPL